MLPRHSARLVSLRNVVYGGRAAGKRQGRVADGIQVLIQHQRVDVSDQHIRAVRRLELGDRVGFNEIVARRVVARIVRKTGDTSVDGLLLRCLDPLRPVNKPPAGMLFRMNAW